MEDLTWHSMVAWPSAPTVSIGLFVCWRSNDHKIPSVGIYIENPIVWTQVSQVSMGIKCSPGARVVAGMTLNLVSSLHVATRYHMTDSRIDYLHLGNDI